MGGMILEISKGSKASTMAPFSSTMASPVPLSGSNGGDDTVPNNGVVDAVDAVDAVVGGVLW